MAGATNRQLKTAGVPKSTINTLRVESGGRLTLRSALSLAGERGLPTGKAAAFLAQRDSKAASAAGAQASQADFRSKAAQHLKAQAESRAAEHAAREKAGADFRSKAAAGLKAGAKVTDRENRAAVIVERLRARATAIGAGNPAGERLFNRAEKIAAKYPVAARLAEQMRKEKRLESKAAVQRVMRTSMQGGTSRSSAGLPPEQSERIKSLLARSKEQADKSASRREAARAAKNERLRTAGASAAERLQTEWKARQRVAEREKLTEMVGDVRNNMARARTALANSTKPHKGLERSVDHNPFNGKTSVRNVKPIVKNGDFFVHKTEGGAAYVVTHRPTGTAVYSGGSLSANKAVLDGIAKTGSKVLARIEGGDLRAAKAWDKYKSRLSSAGFFNRAYAKYEKKA